MQTLYVTYPGKADTRFDRKYYVETHLPLVLESWRKYGLETAAAFFPEGGGEGMIALCVCVFLEEQGIRTAFAAPEAGTVMADIVQFTDAKPGQYLGTPL